MEKSISQLAELTLRDLLLLNTIWQEGHSIDWDEVDSSENVGEKNKRRFVHIQMTPMETKIKKMLALNSLLYDKDCQNTPTEIQKQIGFRHALNHGICAYVA